MTIYEQVYEACRQHFESTGFRPGYLLLGASTWRRLCLEINAPQTTFISTSHGEILIVVDDQTLHMIRPLPQLRYIG